jgi:hypothetical protein
MFEGLTVRNTEVCVLLGLKNIIGSSGFTLVHSKVKTSGARCKTTGPARRTSTSQTTSRIGPAGKRNPSKLLGWYPPASEPLPGFSAAHQLRVPVKCVRAGACRCLQSVSRTGTRIDVAPMAHRAKTRPRAGVRSNFHKTTSRTSTQLIEADGRRPTTSVCSENRCFNTGGRLLQRAARRSAGRPLPSAIRVNGTSAGPSSIFRRGAGNARLPRTRSSARARCSVPVSNVPLPQPNCSGRRLGWAVLQPAHCTRTTRRPDYDVPFGRTPA